MLEAGQPATTPVPDAPSTFQDCKFTHKNKALYDAHALWWPSSQTTQTTSIPSRVLVFIPGNPGLAHFYTPFLSELHVKCDGDLAIVAKAQIGHTPGYEAPSRDFDASCSLEAQIESALELVDAVGSTYPEAQVVLAGHSVGAYICLQVLKAGMHRTRVAGVFLLFPTISHILDTPNGSKFSWLFKAPIPRLISGLTYFARLIPESVLGLLFRDWPHTQVAVLGRMIRSPRCAFAALNMADDEMKTIRDVDDALLEQYRDKMWLFFARHDDWVGKNKERVLTKLGAESCTTRVVHGTAGVPHAFCINHGKLLADQCHLWLQQV